MLRRTSPIPFLLALLAALVLPAGVASPAQAAPKDDYSYVAFSGGTWIQAIGTTISSDLTAQSAISGTYMPNQHSGRVARVDVANIANVGAVETSTKAERTGDGGARITSTAKTADISLLNGLITAKAVESSTVTTGSPEKLDSVSQTRFVDLKIAGITLPVDIPQNYQVSIPGVVSVVVNAHQSGQQNGVSTAYGFALAITLLKPHGNAPLGTTIMVNPTYVMMGFPVPPNNPALGGYAFGTEAIIQATSQIRGEVGRSGQSVTPPNGSGGKTVSNRTAAVTIPGILQVGAVTSSTTSVSEPHHGTIVNEANIAGINVLNGLITADAIQVTARSELNGTTFTSSEDMTFVNLVIAGQPITLGVGPNTKIEIPNVAVVTLNERIKGAYSNEIRGLHVKLLQPYAGLEIGAEIKVAVATTYVWG